jgi:predicted alpha/beta hydrolase
MQGTNSTVTVDERPVEFTADDGVRLRGMWFEPARGQMTPSTAVVIVCGAGIPARFYYGLARYLVIRGAAVLTFDYRGIGTSRVGSLRRMASGMDDWAVYDIGAALVVAGSAYPGLPLSAVAHSVGTLMIGAAPGAGRLSRSVFLGAHTGYWRDYHAKWRWLPFPGVAHVHARRNLDCRLLSRTNVQTGRRPTAPGRSRLGGTASAIIGANASRRTPVSGRTYTVTRNSGQKRSRFS